MRSRIHAESEQSRVSVENYMFDLLKQTFGTSVWPQILYVLSNCENGLCGVETTYFIFPALLMAKEITPQRSYTEEYGLPLSDGQEAATPQQRRIIAEALEKAGYKLVIPPWFNTKYEPKYLYSIKRKKL